MTLSSVLSASSLITSSPHCLKPQRRLPFKGKGGGLRTESVSTVAFERFPSGTAGHTVPYAPTDRRIPLAKILSRKTYHLLYSPTRSTLSSASVWEFSSIFIAQCVLWQTVVWGYQCEQQRRGDVRTVLDGIITSIISTGIQSISYHIRPLTPILITHNINAPTLVSNTSYQYVTYLTSPICHYVSTFSIIYLQHCYNVGIIAPYQKQRRLLKQLFRDKFGPTLGNVEISTVDSYQGREKDIIIFSCVRAPAGQWWRPSQISLSNPHTPVKYPCQISVCAVTYGYTTH